MATEAKKLSQLTPSSKVIIELGKRTHMNLETGEPYDIDKERQQEVPYAYYKQVTETKDEYNPATGFSKVLGRTVKLLGTAGYKTEETESGVKIDVPYVVPFKDESAPDEEPVTQPVVAPVVNEAEKAQLEAEKAQLETEKAELEALKAQLEVEKKKLKDEAKKLKEAQSKVENPPVVQP